MSSPPRASPESAGAKKTSELIPLCHQLALSSVKVEFGFTETSITVEATAKTRGQTGVEMEALTAVAVAGLTLHDMVKAVDPGATMNGVRLLTKDGGKRGHWTRDTQNAQTAPAHTFTSARSATVLVASTRRCERHQTRHHRTHDRDLAT